MSMGQKICPVVPTYLNTEVELTYAIRNLLSLDYSLDDEQVVKFENQDVVDQVNRNSWYRENCQN